MTAPIIIDASTNTDSALDTAAALFIAAHPDETIPDAAEDAWDAYSAQPLNYDASPLFREHDAFIAGWEAARGETA